MCGFSVLKFHDFIINSKIPRLHLRGLGGWVCKIFLICGFGCHGVKIKRNVLVDVAWRIQNLEVFKGTIGSGVNVLK